MTLLLSPRYSFQVVHVLPELFYLHLATLNVKHSLTPTDLVSFAIQEEQVFKGDLLEAAHTTLGVWACQDDI